MLHERIRKLRLAKGMTLQQVGDVFGISKVSVSNWETGTNQPDSKKLTELAKLLGTDVQFLLTGESKPQQQGIGNGIPFIVWSQIGNSKQSTNAYRVQATLTNPGPNAFATKLVGNESLMVDKPNIPEGSVIVVDPDLKPQALDFVLLEHDAIIKLAQVRPTPENKHWLMIFNEKGNEYIKIDTSKVLGVILEWQISGKTRVS